MSSDPPTPGKVREQSQAGQSLPSSGLGQRTVKVWARKELNFLLCDPSLQESEVAGRPSHGGSSLLGEAPHSEFQVPLAYAPAYALFT